MLWRTANSQAARTGHSDNVYYDTLELWYAPMLRQLVNLARLSRMVWSPDPHVK